MAVPVLALAGLCIALVATGVASSPGPYEPNDSKARATGPLRGGVFYGASIEHLADPPTGREDDVDWYFFETFPNVSFDVAYRNMQQAGNCFGPQARLFDADGNQLGTVHPPANQTERISHTTVAGGRFFLRVEPYSIVRCDPPDTAYLFGLTPPSAIRIPPNRPPVKPLPGPRLRVKKAVLRRFLRIEGTRAPRTQISRIRVSAWGKVDDAKLTFSLNVKRAGRGRWVAVRRVPRPLRGRRSLRFQVRYLGDARFSPKVLPVKTARRRR